MNKGAGIRLLLAVYPLFVGGIYLTCSYLPHNKLQSLRNEIEEFTESSEVQESRLEVERRREKQREEMKKLVNRLKPVSDGPNPTRVPRHIADVAEKTGVRLLDVSSEGNETVEGMDSAVMEVSLAGEYREIVEFFSILGSSDDTVSYIRHFTVRPGNGPDNRTASMEVAILQEER